MALRVLIIGGGGREHALAWKIAQSPKVEKIFVTPGNAGSAREARCENVAINAEDVDGLLRFALANKIDLTVVGPEAPLVLGVVDKFRAAGLRIFGPTKAAAQLEGSKAFTKRFLIEHKIPTAVSFTTTVITSTIDNLEDFSYPCVIKADGLAAGKGVFIVDNKQEAIAIAKDLQEKKQLGEAGQTLVVEEYLEGEEASFIVMVDGQHILPLATSQDHKRVDRKSVV